MSSYWEVIKCGSQNYTCKISVRDKSMWLIRAWHPDANVKQVKNGQGNGNESA